MNSVLKLSGMFRRQRPPFRGPQGRLAQPEARVDTGLNFSDFLFVLVLGFATMLAISRPLFGFSAHHTFLNHAPLVLLAPVVALHLLGLQINRVEVPWSRYAAVYWPLLLLSLFALAGSSVAKWDLGVSETYLAFGAYLLLLPLYASFCADPRHVRAWAKAIIGVWIIGSVAAVIGEAGRYGSRDTLHEIEYLVAVGFFGMYYVSRSLLLKILALVLMIGAVVLNQKLTGFLVTALALLHIAITGGWRSVSTQWRLAYVIAALLLTALFVAGLTALYFEFRQYLPSGNAHVRLAQYEQAWAAFLASPLWGNAYLDGSGEWFREGARAFNIPTHSDVLDVLKHGGLIGLTLFLIGYLFIFRLVQRAVSITRGDHLLQSYFLTARFFLVTAFLTFSVNPLLLKGPFLVVIWAHLGLAVGLAVAVLTRPGVSARHEKA